MPIMLTSDETLLTKYSGDKSVWPIYMTIGNIPAGVRAQPLRRALILLGFLPVPPKTGFSNAATDKERQELKALILHTALSAILKPLREAKNGVRLRCSDERDRMCYPILALWMADHMEYIKLFNTSTTSCSVCETPFDQLGSDAVQRYPDRDHRRYEAEWRSSVDRSKSTAERTNARRRLEDVGVKPVPNALWGLPRVDISRLHVPDLLHGCYLGMLKHLLGWLYAFVKKHRRQALFDKVWIGLNPFPGLYRFKKAYSLVKQWQGREMRSMGRVVLICLAATLSTHTPAEEKPIAECLRCVHAYIDHHMFAQYRSHTDGSIDCMMSRWSDFHSSKEVFLEFRAAKKVTDKAKAARKAFQSTLAASQGRTLSARASPAPSSTSRQDRHDAALQVEADALKEGAHYNVLKVHQPAHYGDAGRRFGSLVHLSTELGERAHKEQMKKGYAMSNKQDFERQMITRYSRSSTLHMRQLNVQALSATTAAESDDHGLRRILGSRVPPAKRSITDLSKLSGLASLAASLAFYSAGGRHVHSGECRATAYRKLSIVLPPCLATLPDLTHTVRCTMGERFRSGPERADWVWIDLAGTDPVGSIAIVKALIGMQCAHAGERLALVQLTRWLDRDIVDISRGGRSVVLTDDHRVVDVNAITACAHAILEPVHLERWLINPHVDLWTFDRFHQSF